MGSYPTLQAADTAIEGLQTTYATKYPLVAKDQAGQVTAAIDELKAEYRLIATPAMKVQAKTYPDNLGHQTSLGCFRCHDGGHYLVVKGKVSAKTIPSECSTCHTFPQVSGSASKYPLASKPAGSSLASAIANIPIGAKPADHKDKVYVFSHKNAVEQCRADRDVLRRLSYPQLLRELPQQRCDQGQARLDALQPRRRRGRGGWHAVVQLLPPAHLLRAVPQGPCPGQQRRAGDIKHRAQSLGNRAASRHQA